MSDICLSESLPAVLAQSEEAIAACIGDASLADTYPGFIIDAGFEVVSVDKVSAAAMFGSLSDSKDPVVAEIKKLLSPGQLEEIIHTVWSYTITATKSR